MIPEMARTRPVVDRRTLVLGGLATGGVMLADSVCAPSRAAGLVAGKPAPLFRSPTADGSIVALEQFRGRPVVIEWTNPDCPYVRKHYDTGNMQRLQSDTIAGGAVWLTVMSAAPGKQGHMAPLEALAWIDREKASPTAVLMDHDGALADAYGVSVALHMFVVDATGNLAYQGAVDDKPTARTADVESARNYVRAALTSLAAGIVPSPSITRPYGCNAR